MSDAAPRPVAVLLRDYEWPGVGTHYAAPIYRFYDDGSVYVLDVRRTKFTRWAAPQKIFAIYRPETTVSRDNVPAKVLLCYLHRVQCVGLNIKHGFQMAGADVRSAGPWSPVSYGRYPEEGDCSLPDYHTDDRPYGVDEIIQIASEDGFEPDLVVLADHNDDFYLSGKTSAAKFIAITIENWDHQALERFERRQADAEYWCVRHWQQTARMDGYVGVIEPCPTPPPHFPEKLERFIFAADPVLRPYLGLERDKIVSQMGTPYGPRPAIWNYLRNAFDGALPIGDEEYHGMAPFESPSTLFGLARTHHKMAAVYNRSQFVLSCSNTDFVPSRIPEAFATGAIQLSDDVPAVRECFGVPWPDNDQGIWVRHNRHPEDMERQIRTLLTMPEVMSGIRLRAFHYTFAGNTYAHRARMLLSRVGLEGGYILR